MNDIFERTIGAIQRDRLTSFIKESHELGDACFYFALISAHNYLYPREKLARDISERLRIESTKGKGTKARDFCKDVLRLERDLKVKVDHVVNHTTLTPEEIRKDLRIPNGIPVIDTVDGIDAPIYGQSTGVALLIRKDETGGHYLALAENPRFSDYGYPMGGNTDYTKIKDRYKGAVTFFLIKSQ